ncbi:hybrid sensor histidine kinase/response regulator transcription factor [Nibrella saemangeumensis]|uniref:histidine kinase n=1 Tax=Nibrella saemangeumensis TaxID=1084526 RepID=A0ABP8MNQ6_9BACT
MRHVWWLWLVLSYTSLAKSPIRFHSARLLDTRSGLPQGFIPSLIQDHRGFIWLATKDGLCRYDGHTFTVYRHIPGDSTSLPFNNVRMVVQDARHRLWVKSESHQLAVMEYETGRFRPVTIPRLQQIQDTKAESNCLYPDADGGMWLDVRPHGFGYISPDQKHLTLHSLSPEPDQGVNAFWQDTDRTVWAATDGGLFRRKPGETRFGRLALPGDSRQTVFSLARRPDGRLVLGMKNRVLVLSKQNRPEWDISLPASPSASLPSSIKVNHFGTDNIGRVSAITNDHQGYSYIYNDRQLYRFRNPQTLEEVDWEPQGIAQAGKGYFQLMASMLIDRSEGLWIGTIGYGLVYINLREPLFQSKPYTINFHTDLLTKYYNLKPAEIPERLQIAYSYNIRYVPQPDNSLWISSRGSIYHYRPNTRTFELLEPADDPTTRHAHGGFGTLTLTTDRQGVLWGFKDSYLFSCRPTTRQWQFIRVSPPPSEWLDMVVDDQTCWVSTAGSGLWAYDRRTGRTRWYRQSASPTSLPSDNLLSLVQDPKQPDLLWIATAGAGMCQFNKRTGACTRYSTQTGLPNDVVYCIIPDEAGLLWLSTNTGICRFDPVTRQVIPFYAEDGLQGNEFNRFHGLRMPNGTIYMGGVDGSTWFSPRSIQQLDNYQPAVSLTELWVNNQLVEPKSTGSLLRQTVNETERITLPYNQNFINLGFAAMQYNNPSAIRYRYQLENYTDDWVPAGESRTAVFTGLPPGEYAFRVNATNTLGVWSPHVKTLRITIRPPWWATWWAYLGYALLAVGALYGFIRYRLQQTRLQQEALFQRREAEQLRAVDELKTRFFSNITHEFRTPLSLILAPAETLEQEADIPVPARRKLAGTIHRNADQLLRLINQLLDLAKLEAKAMTVSLSRGNLGTFLSSLAEPFQPKAKQKSIRLQVDITPTPEESWFDQEKLERIVYNLLSNALKFTPANGEVYLTAHQTSGQLALTVRDTGVGIGPEQLPYIFDRFYQGDTSVRRLYQGTGIGLALVKELVDLLNGEVQVSSEPGKGTSFVVRIPILTHAPEGLPTLPESVVLPPLQPESIVALSGKDRANAPDPATLAKGPMILLAEDNTELGDFMESLLRQADYRVWRADNGEDALEIARTNIPDLIVSDVMMPRMDGFELCEHLKQDECTNHIGVLLLTARSAPDSRLTGLRQGADDYITKPFRAEELLLRIQNRLTYQQRLREHLRQTLTADVVPNQLADPFLQRVYNILGRHLDNSTFGVDQLAEELGVGRTSLYRKLKGVSDLSPNELIRNYRLQRAVELLKAGQGISETAYAVGFESPQYFATCFKDLYDCTPSAYVAKWSEKSVE